MNINININSQTAMNEYIKKNTHEISKNKKLLIKLIKLSLNSKWFLSVAILCQTFTAWNYDKLLSKTDIMSLCNGILLSLDKKYNFFPENIMIMINCFQEFALKLPPECHDTWSITNPNPIAIDHFINRYNPIKFIISEPSCPCYHSQFSLLTSFTSDNFKYYVFASDQIMGSSFGNPYNSYPIIHYFLTHQCDTQALFNLIDRILISKNDSISVRTLLLLNDKYQFLNTCNEKTSSIHHIIIEKIASLVIFSKIWFLILKYIVLTIDNDTFFHTQKIPIPTKNVQYYFDIYSVIIGDGDHSYLLPEINIDVEMQEALNILWEKYKSLKYHNDHTIMQMCKIYQYNNCQQLPKSINDLELPYTTVFNSDLPIADLYDTLKNQYLPFWYKDYIIANLTTGVVMTILKDVIHNIIDLPKIIMNSLLDHHCIPDQLFMLAKLVRREELTGKKIEFDEDIVISLGF
jgi:hypothetical protein